MFRQDHGGDEGLTIHKYISHFVDSSGMAA
jgi:hypothetical protein